MNKTNSFMGGSRSYAMLQEGGCSQHQGEPYTNFCSAASCVKPLCPECIEVHEDFHHEIGNKPQVQSFKTVKQRCNRKLKDLLQEIAREAETRGISRDLDMSKTFQASMRQLRDARETVDRAVRTFFSGLQESMRKKMTYITSDKSSLAQRLDRCDSIVRELQNLLKGLESQNGFLETVQKTMRLEGGRLMSKMTEDYSQIEQMRSQFEVTVTVDRNITQALQDLLTDTIVIGQQKSEGSRIPNTGNINRFMGASPRHSQSQFGQAESKYSGYGRKSSRQREEQRSFRSNKFQRPETVQDNVSDRRSQRSRSAERPKRQINVIGMNTFAKESKRKYLHFFQNDDNYLHILDLNKPGAQFQSIRLEIGFKIPYFHKSISTPNGDLYLIGGSIPTTSQKSKKIFKYDFDTKRLNHCATLHHGRSSHALCFNSKYIYVVGGFLEKQVITNKCQRYDIELNRVEQINPCSHPVNSLCLASFNGRYIFKFGGIGPNQQMVHFIEQFDQNVGQWRVLDPTYYGLTSQFVMLSTSAACQITPNEIIVMGGYDENNQGYKQTYMFVAENNSYSIRDLNMHPLPSAEGFWNNTPIIHNKVIYALQNIPTSNKEDCIESDRRILAFDGRGWRTLN